MHSLLSRTPRYESLSDNNLDDETKAIGEDAKYQRSPSVARISPTYDGIWNRNCPYALALLGVLSTLLGVTALFIIDALPGKSPPVCVKCIKCIPKDVEVCLGFPHSFCTLLCLLLVYWIVELAISRHGQWDNAFQYTIHVV